MDPDESVQPNAEETATRSENETSNRLSGSDDRVLSLLSLNIQCLRNKGGMLELFINDSPPDFLCLCEHWLGQDEAGLFQIQGYKMMNAFCRLDHSHGGTIIYVRDKLSSECKSIERYTRMSAELTFECAAVIFKRNTVILCVYRSPTGSIDAFIACLSDIVGDIVSGGLTTIIICGDFNIDNLKFSCHRSYLYDVFNSYNLRSLINSPTRVAHRVDGVTTCSGLDYMVTNISEGNIKSCENFHPGFSDHHCQLLTWATSGGSVGVNRSPIKISFQARQFSDINIAEFRRFFTAGDYLTCQSNVPNPENVSSYFDAFWEHLMWCFTTAFPLVTKRRCINAGPKHVVKFSFTLKKQMKDLSDLRYLCSGFHSDILYDTYKTKRREVIGSIDCEKRSFYSDLISNSKNKTKTTWQLVNNPKKSHKVVKVNYDGRLVDDNAQLVKIFGEYFSTVVQLKLQDHFGRSLSQECTTSRIGSMESLFLAPVVADDVLSVINSLHNRCSAGYDDMPAFFVRKCGDVLSGAIANIFNTSVEHGHFPAFLKTAIVVPVPKKGDQNDLKNYRPIALLSTISKILEKLMVNRIYAFLDKYNLLGRFQHGFRSGHSTETALTGIIQHINDKVDKNEYVVLVSFDLSRAFDTLHPGFVSEKIAKLGLRGRINDWLTSFLSDRDFVVRVGGTRSDHYTTNLGTPQGSVLGPLIFILYINDLSEYLSEGELFAYADDIALVISDPILGGVCQKVNRVINEFKTWCAKNRMIINFDKTTLLKFRSGLHKNAPFSPTLLNTSINFTESVTLLGTVMDCDLTWQQHVDKVAGRLNSAYYALSSLKGKLGSEALLTVYYGVFYPHLSYAILVWGLSPHAHRLFILQKRAIRLIFDIKRRHTCSLTFKNYNILTLTCIYLYKTITLIHSSRSILTTRAEVHKHNTRQNDRICISQHSHTYFQKSPMFAGVRFYNLLPPAFRNTANIRIFKSKLRNFLGRHAFYSVDDFVEGVSNCAHEFI